MICIDTVFNPSGPGCFMQSITEGKEWILENGVLTEQEIKAVKEEMDEIVIVNPFSIQDRQAAFMKLFQDTLTKISKR